MKSVIDSRQIQKKNTQRQGVITAYKETTILAPTTPAYSAHSLQLFLILVSYLFHVVYTPETRVSLIHSKLYTIAFMLVLVHGKSAGKYEHPTHLSH